MTQLTEKALLPPHVHRKFTKMTLLGPKRKVNKSEKVYTLK